VKILFITANRVGDAVLTTGLLSWLVQHDPGASITIACGPYGADLFRVVPGLERLIVMRKKKWNGHWLDLWKECIETKWDLVVDLRNSIISRLLRTDKRVSHRSSKNKRHKVIENAAVLDLDPPPDPHIWIAHKAIREATALLPKDGRPILALGPAANWPLKQWPIEHFIGLVNALTAPTGPLPDAAIMILADKHERDQIAPLLNAIPDNRRIEIIGKNLQTAAACLSCARLYVGNDSGLMHLSAALGTPTLGLFGPGFPDIYGPWGKRCAYARTPETRDELLASLTKQSPPPSTLMSTLTIENAVMSAKALLAKTEENSHSS